MRSSTHFTGRRRSVAAIAATTASTGITSLAAEGAADIRDDHVEALLVESEGMAELGQRAVRVLHRAPHGQPVTVRVVLDDRAAGLDRRRHQPRQPVAPAHDMLGARKRVRDVAASARPNGEIAVGRGGVGHGGTRLVVDLDELRRVLGSRDGGRDHGGDRLAHVAHLVLSENRVGLVGQLHAAWSADRKGSDATAQLGRGDHRQQSGGRVRRPDSRDRGVRVVRANEHGVDHPGTVDVVDVASPSAQHARVLAPAQRHPDHAHPSWSRIQSATSGRYLNGMLLQTCVPSS